MTFFLKLEIFSIGLSLSKKECIQKIQLIFLIKKDKKKDKEKIMMFFLLFLQNL